MNWPAFSGESSHDHFQDKLVLALSLILCALQKSLRVLYLLKFKMRVFFLPKQHGRRFKCLGGWRLNSSFIPRLGAKAGAEPPPTLGQSGS